MSKFTTDEQNVKAYGSASKKALLFAIKRTVSLIFQGLQFFRFLG